MANLKDVLGDKYKEGMSFEELMALDIEVPKPDMSGYISKTRFDEVASEAANYKKQLRANMSDAEAKAAEDAEKYAAIVAERDLLKEERDITKYTQKLMSIGYDDKVASDVATALYKGDTEAVISAMAKFEDAQKKSAVADYVKGTPIPPVENAEKTITKAEFRKMSLSEQMEVYEKNPNLYNELTK